MRVIRLQGFNDRGDVLVAPGKGGSPLMTAAGCIDLCSRLRLPSERLSTRLFFGKASRQPVYAAPEQASVLINEMADHGILGTALERAHQYCQRSGMTVLNQPRGVAALGPDRLADTLGDIAGLQVPRTMACRPTSPAAVMNAIRAAGMAFPVVIEARHNGIRARPVRLNGTSDEHRLHPLPFDGQAFFVHEFIDSRTRDGLFHRQRIFWVGGRPVVVADLFDRQWRVDRKSRQYMRKQEDDRAEWERIRHMQQNLIPGLMPVLAEISNRTRLDFYFLDLHVADESDVRLINLRVDRDPFDLPSGPGLEKTRDRIVQAAQAMLDSTFSKSKENENELQMP